MRKKKTDLDKFIELYKGFGIKLKVQDLDDMKLITLFADDNYFTGYTGFMSEVHFTKEGKFISQGFYE